MTSEITWLPIELDALNEVAAEYRIPSAYILSRAKPDHVAVARFALYARLKDLGRSTVRIGQLLNRDHSTVSYGIHQHYIRNRPPPPDLPSGVMVRCVSDSLHARSDAGGMCGVMTNTADDTVWTDIAEVAS